MSYPFGETVTQINYFCWFWWRLFNCSHSRFIVFARCVVIVIGFDRVCCILRFGVLCGFWPWCWLCFENGFDGLLNRFFGMLFSLLFEWNRLLYFWWWCGYFPFSFPSLWSNKKVRIRQEGDTWVFCRIPVDSKVEVEELVSQIVSVCFWMKVQVEVPTEQLLKT